MTFLAIGTTQILIILLVLLFPIVALISALRHDFRGNDKLIWVLLIIFLPILGSILYFLIGRPKAIR